MKNRSKSSSKTVAKLGKVSAFDDRGQVLKFKGRTTLDQPVLLKMRTGRSKKVLREARTLLDREKIALRALAGLAVPSLIDIQNPGHLTKEKYFWVAMSWINWKPIFSRPISIDQACGLWLFVCEQLCAFRRRGIMYVDLKPHHVLVSPNLMKAVIVDFDGVTSLDASGEYFGNHFATTYAYSPPEIARQDVFKESSFVYGAAMCLAAMISCEITNANLVSEPFKKVCRQLNAGGQADVRRLITTALSDDPKLRPKTYEALFKDARKAIRRREALEIWRRLRAPYSEALTEVGL